MRFGYARVSTDTQELSRQTDALTAAGAQRIFSDTGSGAAVNEGLYALLGQLREGDEVTVCELSRLGRSLAGLMDTVTRIQAAGARIHSLKEGWISTNDAMSKMFFYLLGMFCEMERDYLRERTVQGLKAARARGRMGGRPRMSEGKVKKAVALYHEKRLTVDEIVKVTGVSRATLYRYVRESTNKT